MAFETTVGLVEPASSVPEAGGAYYSLFSFGMEQCTLWPGPCR
jgi:hypothetical protein